MSLFLFIGNLNFETTNDQLHSYLSQHVNIITCQISFDKFSLKSKGFANVEVSSEDSADTLISLLNGKMFNGRPLKIDIYRKES